MFILKVIEKIVSLIPYKARLAVYHTPLLPIGRVILSKVMPSRALVEITGGPLKGFQMWINLKCQKYYWLGTYEPVIQNTLGRIIRQGMVCYDIGAHIGYFSLMMAKSASNSGKVIAFEPDPDNFSLLNEHIRLNGFDDIVKAMPFAVSSKSGSGVFQKGTSSSTGKLSESSDGIEVRLISLDEFVYGQGHPEPDFMKIDVEGFEGEVLSGASKVLTRAQPVILCEIHNPEAAHKVFRKLQEQAYLIRHIEEGFRPVSNPEAGGHWLAYPKGKEEW